MFRTPSTVYYHHPPGCQAKIRGNRGGAAGSGEGGTWGDGGLPAGAGVPLLIEAFLKRPGEADPLASCFTAEALDFLAAYPWPGNVRELKNVCERIRVGARRDGRLDRSEIRRLCDQGVPLGEPPGRPADGMETALARSGGKRGEAARLLGVHRSTLWRWRQRGEKGQAKTG